jgi:hypothetical protein
VTEFCAACEHAEEQHDFDLGFCQVPHCRCNRFVSENDEAESPEIEELNFDDDAD